jgi:glycosyltransferase involved in cell wall biosynthesis
MQQVLVDARVFARGHTGIARYVRELAPRLGAGRGLQLEALVHGNALLPGVEVASRSQSGFLSLAEQVEVPWRVAMWRRTARRGIVWIPAFNVPVALGEPFVATIHDANHLAFPDQYTSAHALYYRTVVRRALNRASAVLVPSQFAAKELIERLGADERRIHVTPLGVTPPPSATTERIAAVRARLGLPQRYVLYLGNFKPHKNLPMLLRAARAFAREVPVVLVGGRPEAIGRPLDEARREGLVIHVVPSLDDTDLWPLVAGASVFAFPSRYEGFGLPPLEAMSIGVPVVTTNAGSLPEVVGSAAPTLDPDDADGFGAAIAAILSDHALAAARSEKGRQQASRFSWEACADRTAELLRAAGAAA